MPNKMKRFALHILEENGQIKHAKKLKEMVSDPDLKVKYGFDDE